MTRSRWIVALACTGLLLAAGVSPASAAPSDRLNLQNWKLTLPVDVSPADGTADEQIGLVGYENAPWFHDNYPVGVGFRAAADGATTPNTDYARSELREMPGGVATGWPGLTGTHEMHLTQAITQTTPDKRHLVAGQIHELNGTQDVLQIRLEGGRLFVESDGVDKGTLTDSYQLGAWFTVVIRTSPSGITVTYNPGPQQVVRSFLPVGFETNWYFKAGLYLQSNEFSEGNDAAQGEVVITDLRVTHSAQAPVPPPSPAPVYCAGLPATHVGTDTSEVIVGTGGNDVIVAGAGNDIVYGFGGDDVICGGSGNDVIKAGGGNRDALYGEDGADKLVGGNGSRDRCVGGPATDRAKGCEIKRSI